jgi:hypothetical protein
MTTPEKCPFCGSANLVEGKIKVSEGAFGFKPDETIPLLFTFRAVAAFKMGPAAVFCGACNMVWCEADSRDAHNFIREYGFESLKARVLAAQSAPSKKPR